MCAEKASTVQGALNCLFEDCVKDQQMKGAAMAEAKQGRTKKKGNAGNSKRFPPLVTQSKTKNGIPDASQFAGQILETLMQPKRRKKVIEKPSLPAGINKLIAELESTGSNITTTGDLKKG